MARDGWLGCKQRAVTGGRGGLRLGHKGPGSTSKRKLGWFTFGESRNPGNRSVGLDIWVTGKASSHPLIGEQALYRHCHRHSDLDMGQDASGYLPTAILPSCSSEDTG